MTLPELIAVTMAAARARLAPELAGLIVPDRAWPLAVLLTAWAKSKAGLLPPGEEGTAAPLPGLFSQAFDFLQGELTPFLMQAARPTSDSLPVRLAGLSVLLAGMIGRIGADTLKSLVTNRQFVTTAEAINRQYPIPAVVLQAFNESGPGSQASPSAGAAPQAKNRIKDFNIFDFPKRNPESDPLFLRRQLNDPAISPEMRMWYEERLAFLGLPKYPSDSEAKLVWESILRGPMAPDVRGYFIDALNALEGRTSEEA
jgi:hypothetical protein